MDNQIKDLRMYVWNNFMTDYAPGMACVMAENVEEALILLEIALANDGLEFFIEQAKNSVPSIYECPTAVYVAGCDGGVTPDDSDNR